jgi:hypothetical protein
MSFSMSRHRHGPSTTAHPISTVLTQRFADQVARHNIAGLPVSGFGTFRRPVEMHCTIEGEITRLALCSPTDIHANAGDWLPFTGSEYEAEAGQPYYRDPSFRVEASRYRLRAPLGYAAGDSNIYRYVHSHPLDAVDSDGMQGQPPGSMPGVPYTPDGGGGGDIRGGPTGPMPGVPYMPGGGNGGMNTWGWDRQPLTPEQKRLLDRLSEIRKQLDGLYQIRDRLSARLNALYRQYPGLRDYRDQLLRLLQEHAVVLARLSQNNLQKLEFWRACASGPFPFLPPWTPWDPAIARDSALIARIKDDIGALESKYSELYGQDVVNKFLDLIGDYMDVLKKISSLLDEQNELERRLFHPNR